MTFPTKPKSPYDYVTFQTNNPTDPLPANQVAGDFASHKTSIDALVDFSKLVQRFDGRLNNGSVRPETLSAGTVALIGKWAPRGNRLTATAYAANDLVTESNNLYVCIVAHTSGTFATDLAAGDWQLIDGDTARIGADQTFTGVNTFSGVSNFGVTNFSGAADFNGATNVDGAFTATGTLGCSGLLTMTGKAINEAQGANIASATTTDIGAATGNYVKVTGTVTITALGTIQAGTRRVVEFTGALLLTHNATSLILPGGANITTAAGDCAEFISEGSGNWRCTQYTRAGASGATIFLTTANVLLGNGTQTNVINTGALPPGTYLLQGSLVGLATSGATVLTADIHDGSVVVASSELVTTGANQAGTVPVTRVVTITAATTFTLRGSGNTGNTSALRATVSGVGTTDKMTSLSWVRLP
jgi:hypothetical protein